jgi:hypothetical protein
MAGTPFHNKVTLAGFHMEDWSLTFYLNAATTAADVGKAVSKDGTTPNQVKLAADGDVIVGRLASYEDRVTEGIKVGAVELKFANKLPIVAGGGSVVVGGSVQGAGAGEVKHLAYDPSLNWVVEVNGLEATVIKA